MKKAFVPLVVLLVVVIAIIGLYWYQVQQKLQVITSFEACAKMFPVMESYPARCVTPDGKSFTQDIGNELKYHDEIIIETPRPNQQISSPLVIKGKARGAWFFEGSFLAELFDAKHNSLGTMILKADGEWMTEDFVSFSGQQIFKSPTTATGTLVIRNANPSGLPENQKELRIPVRF